MPLNLYNQSAFATDEILRVRVAMAFYLIAREVMDEGSAIPGHALRVNFARVVIGSDYDQFYKYGSVVASDPIMIAINPVDGSSVSDEQIITVVRNNWNAISGYIPADDY